MAIKGVQAKTSTVLEESWAWNEFPILSHTFFSPSSLSVSFLSLLPNMYVYMYMYVCLCVCLFVFYEWEISTEVLTEINRGKISCSAHYLSHQV